MLRLQCYVVMLLSGLIQLVIIDKTCHSHYPQWLIYIPNWDRTDVYHDLWVMRATHPVLRAMFFTKYTMPAPWVQYLDRATSCEEYHQQNNKDAWTNHEYIYLPGCDHHSNIVQNNGLLEYGNVIWAPYTKRD